MKLHNLFNKMKRIFKEQVADYTFKDISPTDYELELIINVNKQVWGFILDNTVKAARGRVEAGEYDKIKAEKALKAMTCYPIDPRFFNRMNVILKDTVKVIDTELNREFDIGIKDYEVVKGEFLKELGGEEWKVIIYISGSYAVLENEENQNNN